MSTRLLLIHALSPIHCGTGQAIGGIDLPIAREKPTNLPLIPGSSIKGVLRARGTNDSTMQAAVFGPDTKNAADNAGSVQFADALLAFLPVRSIRGTFAWVTAPFMLRRLARDATEAGVDLGALPTAPGDGQARVTGERLKAGDRVVFEDFDFTAVNESSLNALATKVAGKLFDDKTEQALFAERVCLVSDDVMGLLLQTCTEITSRISMDPEKGTVARGALWTEEALPVETILVGLVAATPVTQKDGSTPDPTKLLDHVGSLLKGAVQLGGNATVGRGLCRLKLAGK
jgi:CRISPR-associated protein Cmr4